MVDNLQAKNLNINQDINKFASKLYFDLGKYQSMKKSSGDSLDARLSIDFSKSKENRLKEYLNSDLIQSLLTSPPPDILKDQKPSTEKIPQISLNTKKEEEKKSNANSVSIDLQQIQYQPFYPQQHNYYSNTNNPIYANNFNNTYHPKNNYGKKKKGFVERAGDWTCFSCKNLNFAFRTKCNRCQMPKEYSEKKYEEYMKSVMNNMGGNKINI